MIAKLISIMLFILPSITLMLLHSGYYLMSSRYRGIRHVERYSGVSIIVPIKNEPEELIVKLVENLGHLKGDYELIIISDDPIDRALTLKEICESRARELNLKLKFIIGDPSKGSRVKALNRGITEASHDYVLVLDVDARPTEECIERLVECVNSGYDACVGRWRGYYDAETRLARAISMAMKYTVDTLYKGRSALNLFIFPLGSGTLFRRDALIKVGLWDEVIQDDMYMGIKFLINGFKTAYVDDAVLDVLVPSTYAALRIQQGRWAYGAVEVLRKLFKDFINADVGLLIKIEAILFLLQYVPTAMLFLGSLIIPFASLIAKDDLLNLGIGGISGILIPTVLYASTIYRSLSSDCRDKVRVIKSMGSSAAITVALLPVISLNTLGSILGLPARYKVTPKGSSELGLLNTKYVTESTYLIYMFSMTVLNLIYGNLFTALWCLALTSALTYVFMRAEKEVTNRPLPPKG